MQSESGGRMVAGTEWQTVLKVSDSICCGYICAIYDWAVLWPTRNESMPFIRCSKPAMRTATVEGWKHHLSWWWPMVKVVLVVYGYLDLELRFRASLLWFCSEATFDANNFSYCSWSLLKQQGAALVCCRGRNSNRMSHKHESDRKVLLQCKWCISPCRMCSSWRCKIQLIDTRLWGVLTPHYLCIGWSFLDALMPLIVQTKWCQVQEPLKPTEAEVQAMSAWWMISIDPWDV